ncbi:MAG: M48 family metallopeptidase, partial [Rubrimonas sp.]
MGEVIRLDDPDIAVRLNRSARARRFTLSLRPGAPEARLTAPAHAPEREARAFLLRHSDWLRDAIARAPRAVAVGDGATLPIGGRMTQVRVAPGLRSCRLEGDALLAPAVAGPAVAAFLKLRARDAIAPEALRAAAALGRTPRRIAFRDTRSRWGSCSAQGDLAFSWRLAMAPPEVQAYVAVHEAAHLVEMNHGPGFWALVARLMPDYRLRRAWLRREGAGLHLYR